MKRWLDAQPAPRTVAQLQALIDDFVDTYNHHRPHRSLAGRVTPAVAYQTRPKATPGTIDAAHHRIRHDIIDPSGKVTLRHAGHLYKIGIGRRWARTPIVMLIDTLDIRIIHATNANSSATSPWTPPAPTSPPATPAATHPETSDTRTLKRGFRRPGCPDT